MRIAISLLNTFKKNALRGRRFYCPLCQSSYWKFLSAGTPRRLNSRCPGCGSLERHRLLWVTLNRLHAQGALIQGGRLLHVAPEYCLENEFRKKYDYISVDMYARNVTIKTDVSALCFPDECFDVIVCNHVLEHVENDRQALSELFRVLKRDGWGSIQVPIRGSVTLEDPTVTTPIEREQLYGQADHVRQYGDDYKFRLEEAGFEVGEIKKNDMLDKNILKRLSIECEENVILVRKRFFANTPSPNHD